MGTKVSPLPFYNVFASNYNLLLGKVFLEKAFFLRSLLLGPIINVGVKKLEKLGESGKKVLLSRWKLYFHIAPNDIAQPRSANLSRSLVDSNER